MTIADNIFIYQIMEEEQLEKPDQLVVILTGHGQSVASYSVSVCVSEREREQWSLHWEKRRPTHSL